MISCDRYHPGRVRLIEHESMNVGRCSSPGTGFVLGNAGRGDELMGAVLIVDDSAADRALLRTILGRAGYTVYEVAKGGEAVHKAREVRPHIIILDVNLPDLNGLAVCRARSAPTAKSPACRS